MFQIEKKKKNQTDVGWLFITKLNIQLKLSPASSITRCLLKGNGIIDPHKMIHINIHKFYL